MDISKLSAQYFVRRLTEDDVEMIYDLSSGNSIYYRYHPPFVTREGILEDMTALPPGKEYDDKFYIGFFDGAALVAVMDLILDYHEAGVAFIGFFMTDVKYQGKGIGSGIISDAAAYLKSLGYDEIRLGVDKGNPQSYAFWTKNKFSPVSEDEYILMSRHI